VSPAERRNAHLKLVANWSNTIATSIVTAGTFVPAAQFIYGLLPKDADLVLVYGTGTLCIGTGVLIHLFGQWFLRGLQ
jgi:hypothetical protein